MAVAELPARVATKSGAAGNLGEKVATSWATHVVRCLQRVFALQTGDAFAFRERILARLSSLGPRAFGTDWYVVPMGGSVDRHQQESERDRELGGTVSIRFDAFFDPKSQIRPLGSADSTRQPDLAVDFPFEEHLSIERNLKLLQEFLESQFRGFTADVRELARLQREVEEKARGAQTARTRSASAA